jgi:hypothetical protein
MIHNLITLRSLRFPLSITHHTKHGALLTSHRRFCAAGQETARITALQILRAWRTVEGPAASTARGQGKLGHRCS